MAAILSASLPIKVAAVISNRADAAGLELAAAQGIPTAVVDHGAFATREDFDAALQNAIDQFSPQLVVLAGFMRILSPQFVAHYEKRLINIHPSLLPAFPGLHTHRQALAAGVRIHGCTVHFVTDRLDHGPIVVQAAVPVLQGDTEALLSARVLRREHVIYPRALRWWAEGRLHWQEDRIHVDGEFQNFGGLSAPEPVA